MKQAQDKTSTQTKIFAQPDAKSTTSTHGVAESTTPPSRETIVTVLRWLQLGHDNADVIDEHSTMAYEDIVASLGVLVQRGYATRTKDGRYKITSKGKETKTA
jgi:LDH2 family malate/lactate/ureidoglycolate dehydrogenase